MGYELHLIKVWDWNVYPPAFPLGFDDWHSFADNSELLTSFETFDSGDERHETVYFLSDFGMEGPSLWLSGGDVHIKGAEENCLPVLMDIARAVDRDLVGDDGEQYVEQSDGVIAGSLDRFGIPKRYELEKPSFMRRLFRRTQ